MEGGEQRASGKRTSENQNSNETADTENSSKKSRQEKDANLQAKSDVSFSTTPGPVREDIMDSSDAQTECEGGPSCSQEDGAMVRIPARTDCADRISRFPELVQDKVFRFLSARDKVRAAQVCSAWLHAVNRPCHWRNLTLKLSLDRLSEEELNSMKEKKICQVEIMTGTDDLKLQRFLREYPSLESLTLTTPSHIYALLETVSGTEFVSLTKLDLNLSTGSERLIQRLQDSLRSFPNLSWFQINGPVSSSLVTAIGRELPGLIYLGLQSAPPSRPLDFQGLAELRKLKYLKLWGYELAGDNTIPVLKTVEQLVLRCCIHPIDKWRKILSEMSSLEELYLTNFCDRIEDGEMSLFDQILVKLRIFRFMPVNLKLLETDVQCLGKMSSLQEFCLSGQISDDGIQALRKLKHLKTLTLYNCSEITVEGMKLIGQISPLQNLKMYSGHHGDVLLRGLVHGSCRLKSLCLVDITGMSSEDMAHIANMSSLRDLALYRVNVGPIGMELLNKGNFSLGSLKLFGCGVTVQGLMPLFEKQTTLRELKLEGMEIEAVDISLLKTVLPNLEYVMVSGRANAESQSEEN